MLVPFSYSSGVIRTGQEQTNTNAVDFRFFFFFFSSVISNRLSYISPARRKHISQGRHDTSPCLYVIGLESIFFSKNSLFSVVPPIVWISQEASLVEKLVILQNEFVPVFPAAIAASSKQAGNIFALYIILCRFCVVAFVFCDKSCALALNR